MRFKNSGLNVRLIESSIVDFICSYCPSGDLSENPIEPPALISRTPTFDVMMMTVFLKSIFRPKPSVKIPSSKT